MNDLVVGLVLLAVYVVAALLIGWWAGVFGPRAAAAQAPRAAAVAPASPAPEAAGPYGAGSAASLPDGSAPAGFTIKGNADSGLYHTTDSPYYGRTKAEAWFATEADAVRAGFTRWDRRA